MPLATSFPGLVVEGGFFPQDAIEALAPRVAIAPGKAANKAAKTAFLPGFLDPAGYSLPPGVDIDEKAQQEFASLRKAWRAFDAHRENTLVQWSPHLFQALGYGFLARGPALRAAGRDFPIHYSFQSVPLHLVSHKDDLDKLPHQPSPHALVQEFLNRSDDHMYGIACNGLRLRLLRDNVRLVRQAHLEFDLEAIFQGDHYATFAILFRLLHASRFARLPGSDSPASCLFEQAAIHAASTAIRALETLRGNIEQALKDLGTGFLRHGPLRQKLRDGSLHPRSYHRQLVRMLYRLLFLAIAEDRGLLHPDDADPEARALYDAGYSMRRVRSLAMAIKGSERHHDIFESTRVVLGLLGNSEYKNEKRAPNEGDPLTSLRSVRGSFEGDPLTSLRSVRGSLHDAHAALALVPLGSLFRPEQTPDLNDAPLPNADYLAAIRALVTTTDASGQRRTVDLSHLGAEEIGSVYERLLEIEPVISWDPPRFDTPSTAGNERKTTGSYYTPDSLVRSLLDSALDPVMDAALERAGPHPVARANALLALRVCDPACGSGHFLVAAARRLGLRLARVRALDHEPSPPEVRQALRDVISRCVYGVDLNPMAVELCQFALWLEALSPGRPLGFLRHHIRHGNSLMGARADLLGNGIPDKAFAPIEGDNKEIAAEFKKKNKVERGLKTTQGDMFLVGNAEAVADYLARVRALDQAPEETVADILAKDREFDDLEKEATYRQTALKFDLWCAAFAQWKVASDTGGITTLVLRRVENNPYDISPVHYAETRRLAGVYRFFHFPVAFPTVFNNGGFDCVLGNPPWERIKLQEQEYFAAAGYPKIAEARNAAVRKKLIEELAATDPRAHGAFLEARRVAEVESQFARTSGAFPLCGRGDVNTYALFAELNRQLVGPHGRAGFIVPSGIATDDTTKYYFQDLVKKRALVSLYDFENAGGVFESVHRSFKFCALTATNGGNEAPAEVVCFAHQVSDLNDPEKRFSLTPEEFELLNPNTRTLPIFRSKRDAELTKGIYRRVPVMLREESKENPWGVSFMAMFHMATDSGLFLPEPGEGLVRLFEAKMLHQFDHRWATFETVKDETDSRAMTQEEKQNPEALAQPQYWVPKSDVDNRLAGKWDKGWLMGWRDICRNTDVRTTIASVLPREGVGHTFPMLFTDQPAERIACLYASVNSFVFDYAARQKVGGTHLTYNIVHQLPVLPPEAYGKWGGWIAERVLELVYTAVDLEPFARDLGYAGPPFAWDPERRFRLRCELDALFFRLYGVARDDAEYILGTFTKVESNDMNEFKTFRTRDEILRMYDGLEGEGF